MIEEASGSPRGFCPFSPEQRQVIESFGQGMAVLAGAGTGKTTTLVAKCLQLLKRKPGAHFAAVSFTERSTSDLRTKLVKELSPGASLTPHWVMTIHGLCATVLRENPREAGFDGEESMLTEGEARLIWERAVEALWLEELRPEVQSALNKILARESLDSLTGLLVRAKDLSGFGALERLHARGAEDPAAGALAILTGFVLDRYDRQKRRRGVLDFNDLERGADRALAHPHVRRGYHEKFELVLVDEFQDTNPLQAGILRRFCREDASNLCVVGDPKQSIYRFRDADVGVFMEFCELLPARYSLTWNFRSRPGVLEYANATCAPLFETAPDEETRVHYEPLSPRREAGRGAAVLRLEVASPDELASWIQGQVRLGVKLEDMALLLRRIRGNERWLKALTGAGLPIALGGGGLFWEDPRVRECAALLKWWNSPGNTLSAATFLRAPWVGIPDPLIDRWIKEDRSLAGPFFRSGHPLARILAPLRGRGARPGEVLLALLEEDPAAQVLGTTSEDDFEMSWNMAARRSELGAPLLALWHRVEELSSRGLGFQEVVRDLGMALDQGRRERDVPPPKNQGQLSVLTLHSSKGLEFEHVILLDFGKKARAHRSPHLFWDRRSGAYLAPRDENGDWVERDPELLRWKEKEKAKELAESKRLFYVALTRARERLILTCLDLAKDVAPAGEKAGSKEGPSKAKETSELPGLQDDWRAWLDSGPAITGARVSGAVVSEASEKLASLEVPLPGRGSAVRREIPRILMKRARHSVTEWNLLSRCPRAYEWAFIRPRIAPSGQGSVGGEWEDGSVPTALSHQELGTRVHGCLERVDGAGLRTLEKEAGRDRFAAQPLIEWMASSEWMAPTSAERGRLVFGELPFEVSVGSEILVGSIDRLIRMEGGGFWVIDYKVSRNHKARPAILEAYATQLALYAYALRELEKDARLPGVVQAWIVSITPESVREIQVDLPTGGGEGLALELASKASRIIQGEPGEARTGILCRSCEFRAGCPEGNSFNDGP